jgi:hypothetical protein
MLSFVKLQVLPLARLKQITSNSPLAGNRIAGNRTRDEEEQNGMRRFTAVLISALALGTIVASTGCAEHRYRTYDPYRNDYHTWNSGEDVYYRQWIGERHYDYVDYKRQDKEHQKEYWKWRHDHDAHGDHDKH